MPCAVGRHLAFHQGELRQGNPGAIEANLLVRTADVLEPLRQGLRARKHQRHQREEFLHGVEILRLMLARHHVRTVKGDDRWALPPLHERAEMHASVAEINMHHISAPTSKERRQLLHLAPVMERRNAPDELQIKASQKGLLRLGKQFDIPERIKLGALPFLGHHKRLIPLQRADLPVNVQHLRLEKRGAVAGNNRLLHDGKNTTAPLFHRPRRKAFPSAPRTDAAPGSP